jgi:hypothetical protein
MNCREFEALIALDVGGDLNAEEAAAVQQHLAVCSGCQALAEELRESQIVLKELAADEPDPVVYSAMRARLLAASEPRRRWVWALAAAAVVIIGLATVVWQYERRLTEIPPPEMARASLPTPSAPELKTRPVHRATRPRRVPPPKPVAARAAEPMVMKLLTDDPNVVIYWIVDETGD